MEFVTNQVGKVICLNNYRNSPPNRSFPFSICIIEERNIRNQIDYHEANNELRGHRKNGIIATREIKLFKDEIRFQIF